jgi:hypothetical protein
MGRRCGWKRGNEVQASVGLMLVDVVMIIGLSSEEQMAVLGEDLHKEFIQIVRYNKGNG